MGANLLPLPWARLTYNRGIEAYQLDIDDDELRGAPSFRADKDFDWGDRSQEAELHRYYGIAPYWGGSDRALKIAQSSHAAVGRPRERTAGVPREPANRESRSR